VECWCGYLSGARCRLAYGPADATATHVRACVFYVCMYVSAVWEILTTFQLKAWEKETRALSVLPYGMYSKYDTLLCFCELDILVL